MSAVLESPSQTSLRLTRQFPQSREKVFRAWTDPQALKHWFAPDASAEVKAEIDLRVGGKYKIVILKTGGDRDCVGGIYREVQPSARLVFTWAWETTPERESLVTVELKDKDGGTELVLTHERFFDAAACERHTRGWTHLLGRLAQVHL
jgi:uncharacterized protein YndB with AHSA1/START domain